MEAIHASRAAEACAITAEMMMMCLLGLGSASTHRRAGTWNAWKRATFDLRRHPLYRVASPRFSFISIPKLGLISAANETSMPTISKIPGCQRREVHRRFCHRSYPSSFRTTPMNSGASPPPIRSAAMKSGADRRCARTDRRWNAVHLLRQDGSLPFTFPRATMPRAYDTIREPIWMRHAWNRYGIATRSIR